MFTRRASDEEWVKYLLNTGLMSVDQYQTMKGGKNQGDITELFYANAHLFDDTIWINKALQQDRFSYVPTERIEPTEIEAFHAAFPLLLARCINDQVIPLSYKNQILYLGLLRYDTEFEELTNILKEVPSDLLVLLVPLGPNGYVRLWPIIRGMTQR